MLNQSKSEILTEKFNRLYPAGHSNFRGKLDAGKTKLFVERAQGSHVWDVDGNEYIEYNGAMGPVLLGHRHPEYVSALHGYLDSQATIYGTNLLYGENDIELAELLVRHIPCAEEVKFCVTGSEAVQMLFRIARAYTGRSRVLRFGEMYHGWIDNVMDCVAREGTDYSEMPLPADTPEDHFQFTEGRSPWTVEESLVVPYNDTSAVETVMEKYHDEIALVFMEPMVSDAFCLHPLPGYLERIRELCDRYGIVMGFDEIITGFRLGLGGAQEYLGVTPDVCTLGKSISGGLPFSAVVGKKEVMDVFRTKTVMGAGTYNGYGLGVQACLTAILLYERDGCAMLKNIYRLQDRLSDGMLEIAARNGMPLTITEAPGVFYTVFGVDGGRQKPTDLAIIDDLDREFYDLFRFYLMHEGVVVMANCRWFVGGSHTDGDVDKTLAAFENALKKAKAELGR